MGLKLILSSVGIADFFRYLNSYGFFREKFTKGDGRIPLKQSPCGASGSCCLVGRDETDPESLLDLVRNYQRKIIYQRSHGFRIGSGKFLVSNSKFNFGHASKPMSMRIIESTAAIPLLSIPLQTYSSAIIVRNS